MAMQMMKRSMSRMLKQSIVDLCRSSIGAEGYVEIDGIVCITIGEEETEEIVVKVHEILGDEDDLPVNIRRNNPMTQRNVPPANQQGGRMQQQQQQQQQQQRQSQSMPMVNSQHSGKGIYSQSPGKHSQAHHSSSSFTQAGHARSHPSGDSVGYKRQQPPTPTKNQPDAKKPPPQMLDEGIIKIEIESDDDESVTPPSSSGKDRPSKGVVCNICEMSLPSPTALKKHITEVHHASFCEICWQPFASKTDLETHMKTHNKSRQDRALSSPCSDGKAEKKGDERFKCGVCGNTSDSRQVMVDHLKSGHEFQGCYTCMLCREYFPNKPTFTIHRKLSHPHATDIMCVNCGVGLKQSEFECHRKECLGEDPTPLPSVKKGKKSKDTDSEPPPAKRQCSNPPNSGKATNKPANTDKANHFECQICCLLLDNFSAYGQHIKSVHQRFVCPICACTFQSNRAVQQHTTRHTSSLPFPCDNCGIGSHNEDQFKRHNIVTHNQRPGLFTCAQCDIMLGSKEEFQGHMSEVHKVDYLGDEELEKYVVLEMDHDEMYNDEEGDYMDDEGYAQNHGEYDNGEGYGEHEGHYMDDEEEAYEEGNELDPTNLVTCNICELMMPSVTALKEHIHGVHHAVVCETCWRPFLSQAELDTHGKVHQTDGSSSVQKPKSPKAKDIPKASAAKPASAKAEGATPGRAATNKSGLSFKCGVCGSGSDGRRGMVEHLRAAHEYLGCYTCLICGEFFPNKPTFTIHRKLSHSDANEMICQSCGVGLMEHEFDQHIEECESGGIDIKETE